MYCYERSAQGQKQGLTLAVAMGQAAHLFKYFGWHIITGKAPKRGCMAKVFIECYGHGAETILGFR